MLPETPCRKVSGSTEECRDKWSLQRSSPIDPLPVDNKLVHGDGGAGVTHHATDSVLRIVLRFHLQSLHGRKC
jgi:hypothetical protein